MTDDVDRPGRPAPSTYRNRRLGLLVGLLVVVVLIAVGVRVLVGDDDEGPDEPAGEVASEPRDAAAVLEELREDPCSIVVQREVEGIVQRSAESSSDIGGLCSYVLAPALDATDGGLVTLQVFGPLAEDAFAGLVEDGESLDTDPEGHWLDEGRALALDGAVAIEVAVRLPGEGADREREVAGELLELAAIRVPLNEAGSGDGVDPAPGGVPEPCPFLDPADTAELLAGTEREPGANPDICSYRAPDRFVTVERIADPSLELDAIRRSSGSGEEEVEWPREDLDVADGGVWLTPPGDTPTSGELYARVGSTLVHVSVSGGSIDEARELAIALVGAVE